MALSRISLVFRKYHNITPITGCFFSTGSPLANNVNVAVVLSGCGVYDGTEIHEATGILVHLSRSQANVAVFAPDKDQMHVIDHIDGEPAKKETRNVLVESARIARGQIQSIKRLKSSVFDAVVFPGGFGAAKNLSSFAVDGTEMTVDEQVERVLKEFHSAKKPIGLCCISPILAAKVIKGCQVTLGRNEEGDEWPHSNACSAAVKMGAEHVDKNINVHVDEKNLIVTTPAFMYRYAQLHEVFDGVGLMVKSLLNLIKK